MHHGLYSSAIKKAVRYFMTDIEITGEDVDYKVRKKYLKTVNDNFKIMTELATLGDDYIAFGNSFTSVHIPFTRVLACPSCGARHPLDHMKPYVKWKEYGFHGKCPGQKDKKPCRFNGEFTVDDMRKPDADLKPVITRWPPQYMMINKHPISGRTKYSLDLPKYTDLLNGVKNGDMLYLEDTPWEIVQAIKNNQRFEFAEDQIYHMAYPYVSCCIPTLKGWGIPPFMSEFETVVLITMLDKYNEAIIVDYLVPFRVLSPPAAKGAGPDLDPMLQINAGTFMQNCQRMLAQHRRNPTGWNFLPFPVEYQVLGGEAKDLAPVELMEHFEMRLLHSIGIPQEFYNSSLNSAGPIIGFRMFERFWQFFASEMDGWLTWVIQKQGELLTWEKVAARIIPVSIYEDPDTKAAKMELAAAGQISQTTAYRSLDIDREYEERRKLEEQQETEELLQEQQKDMETRGANAEAMRVPSPGEQELMAQEAEAQQGQAAAGQPAPPMGAGQPAGGLGGGVGTNASIDDIMLQAEQIANQLLVMDPLTRRRQLGDLKNQNEALYAQVKSKLQQLESEAKTQGVQAARAGQMPPQG
jgi:hypothetical protein